MANPLLKAIIWWQFYNKKPLDISIDMSYKKGQSYNE